MESPQSPVRFIVRDANAGDRDVIVDYNLRLADETEAKSLVLEVVRRGVEVALGDPERLRYWVVEEVETGRVVGQSAITREWSDWRAGWIWWFQSVYVAADRRGQGVFRQLHGHIREAARNQPDVIGLRLYVESENHRAQASYKALGFEPPGYEVYEEIWRERF